MRIRKVEKNIKKAEAFQALYDALDEIVDTRKAESVVPIWELEELINLYSNLYDNKSSSKA